MQPLSSDREEKEGGVTRIDWDLIISVQASDRNPKEFTIQALPETKKKQGGIINKTNAQSMVFQCKERNRLLTEMMHKIHIYNGEKPYLVEKAQHQTDIYKEGSKRQVSLRLHPTIIKVIIKPRDNQKRLGGRLVGVSAFRSQARQNSKFGDEETKRPFDESYEESEAYEDVATEEFFQDENDDEDFEAYESEGQGMSGTILTPYKGSMIGGTILGEESAQPGTANDQAQSQPFRQHFIYLCEIEKVISYQNQLIIVKKNQEIDKFILRSEERVREFVNWLKKNHKEHFKSALNSTNVQSFEYDKIFEDMDFLQRDTKAQYTQDISAFTWDGVVSGLQIEIDENYIYEVDKALNKVRKRCQLKDLEMIRINDKSQSYNLVLMFKKEIEMVIIVPTLAEREKLLSTLLTLRSLQIPSSGFVDLLTILVNSQIDFSQKILGHDPLENTQYIQEYEGLLFRKITENINYKDTMKINNLIEEAVLNASFANLVKIDQRSIKIIIREIIQQLEKYLQFELSESSLVEQLLKKSSEDHIIDFHSFKKKQPAQPQNILPTHGSLMNDMSNPRDNMMIYTEEGVERVKQYEKLQEGTAKYLNILHLLLNSKIVLAETHEYEDLVYYLIKMLICKNSYLGLLSSQVIKSLIQHYSGNEGKVEQINKRILIRGKQSLQNTQVLQHQDYLNFNNQNSNQYQIGEPVFLVQAVKDYFLYFQHLLDTQNIVKGLHLYSISNILRSVLQLRRQSTGKEELKVFADMINEDDLVFLQVQQEERLKVNLLNQSVHEQKDKKTKKEDPLKNKPMFHLVDKFCLLGLDHCDVQLMFTLILNETLNYFKRYDTDKLVQFQQYILTYSIQFVWHLYTQMESSIKEQRKLSIQTLSKLLYQNKDGISLLLRCFPKTLIEKVETNIDLIQSQSWNDQEWEDFFMKVTYKNYDTATEQWNDETRNELKERLQQELHEFQQAKKLHQEVISDDQRRDLVLPNHEFNRSKKVISRSINLKWNFMEFGVKYRCLNQKYLVWKYYLTKLLVESNLQETQRPYFTQQILKPTVFWQELKIKFMSSFDPQEQIIILKTMCVLYNTHHQQLKDLKTIPYLLKLFDQQQYEHCHFILIQLMHVALSIEREYAIKNMKKFIKSDGLSILMNCMKLVFKELLRQDRGKQIDQNPQLLVLSTFSREQFEKIVHGEGILKDQANFTNSNTNSRYFKRNSEYVCMGILSLKILDLIFKEMCAIDYVPLPTNREFLLRPFSLATLTQCLMVENIDLTRELTIFIQTHMNNHFSYFKLKNSGMIEYLILCLSSRNGDRALDILQKFQEVSFDFNNHLKLGLFNSNDLKMLQDDKEKAYKSHYIGTEFDNQNDTNKLNENRKYTILAESIFLRYLPIPFIKFLYEEGQQKFLEIYKMQFFESPILIWNSKLRQILEDNIKEHSQKFIEQLKEFANQPSHDLKHSEDMPIYKKEFRNIVKYPDIENEVRCGRYYLRVWVNQKKKDPNFFDIPRDEEDEFHKNLQIELRHCIYEENFKDQQKIIILFKACLQALHRFNTKRIVSLDEIKKILMDTCKNQPFYTDTVKQMVYIGIKIINLVVRQESQYFFKNTAKTNADSLREVLTKIGVEIIGEIFNLILKNSFNSSHLSMNYSRNVQNDDDSNNDASLFGNTDNVGAYNESTKKITIDRIEAKTLSLCIQSFNIILNTDIQAFVDFPLSNRINLFKQISRLIDVSFHLIPIFKDKQLTNNIYQFDSTTYGSYNQPQMVSPKSKSKKNKSKRRSKSKRKTKAVNQAPNNNHQSWQMANITANNQSSYNPHLGQIFSKPTQNQLFNELEKYSYARQKDPKERKKIHKKDPNIDYKQYSLLQIIHEKTDKHSIELIFDITRSIFQLTREITKNPVLHPELIASGMTWKAMKYIYFSLKEETGTFQDLRASLREATVTLKNLISFAYQLALSGAETFAFKNLTKETEKDIMKNFWRCIKAIFVQKIQDTLISQFVITNNELIFAPYDPRKFLHQFSVREENSPELVWNGETRQELLEALDKQIANLHYSFYDYLINFEYSVNKRELRVEEIFVRHFNNQNEFKPANLESFAQKLVEKLKEYIEFRFVADLDQEQYLNTIEILKALRILLINENLMIDDQDKFDDYISVICNMIQIKTDEQGQDNLTQDEIDGIKGVSSIILDIILHISKIGGLHFDYLKNNNDFIRLLIRALYKKEKEIIDSSITIQILQNMLSSKEIDINQFLINTGLIMFILNQIFEKKPQNSNKKERVELIKLILQATPYTQGIYSKFIPQYFFVEIQSKLINDPDTEKIIEFIKELDAQEFENVFIIWNSALKNESHMRIKNNCEQIVKSYDDSYYQVHLDLSELYKQDYVFIDYFSPKLDNEVIVSDVIVRLYNKNPAVYINIKLNSFILYLTQETQKIAQELYKLGQQHRDDFIMDDFIGRESLSNQNQSVQRKFKALCNQSLMLLTSLLLSLEQLLLNDFNPNRLMANKKEDKNAETKFYRQIIEKLTDQTQLDHKVYQIIGFWLQSQVFMSRYIPIEIRLTFLQIIFLIIDVSDSVKTLKENGDSLLNFLYDTISNIHSDKFSKTIEEAMILLITQKLLRKDPDTTPKLINSSMQKLFKIYEKKKKLKKLVEFILALMASDMQYKQSAVEFIIQNQTSINIDNKVKNNRTRMISGIMLDGRQENEHTEAIMRIWRGKPTSASDAKRFYDISECYHIEEKLDETNIPKMKLPLLSRKSAQQYQREELFYEEEKKKPSETLAKKLKGKSNMDLPLIAPPSVKETKLGYQPILDEVSQIGGIELEEIEKKDESFIDEGDIDT